MNDSSYKADVVIVGAGFGGLAAAVALRKVAVRVTIIDRTNHHLFQPLLYQVATAGLSPADISAPIRAVVRRQPNTEVIMAEVAGVDLDLQSVRLEDRNIRYDYLILATGSRDNYFSHPEWSRFAPGLKTIADATDIRRRILTAFETAETEEDPKKRTHLMTFVLVGAGATGVEMAGAIAELSHVALAEDFRHIDPRDARIILVEAGPRILPQFPESLSDVARAELERHGVEVRTGVMVEEIDAEGVRIGDERIESRTVIWAAGVRASSAAEWLSAESDRSGRVIVEPDLSVSGHAKVFVIGDAAAVRDYPLPGVAQVALQQGKHAAWRIECRVNGYPEPGPFKYQDKGSLATVGRSFAVMQYGPIRLSGFVAWMAWLLVHIWYLIGFRNRMLVMFQWTWAYFTFQRGARLIPPRPEVTRETRMNSPATGD